MWNYKCKTERGKTSETLQRQAEDAAEISWMSLYRFLTKVKVDKVPAVGYKLRLVFTLEQENKIANHILKCSSIYFGFLPEEVQRLTYECEVKIFIEKQKSTNRSWLIHWISEAEPCFFITDPRSIRDLESGQDRSNDRREAKKDSGSKRYKAGGCYGVCWAWHYGDCPACNQ